MYERVKEMRAACCHVSCIRVKAWVQHGGVEPVVMFGAAGFASICVNGFAGLFVRIAWTIIRCMWFVLWDKAGWFEMLVQHGPMSCRCAFANLASRSELL